MHSLGMAWESVYLLIIFPALISSAESITGYFCPLNGTLPACEERFRKSNFSSTFTSLDSLINLNGMMDFKRNVTSFCSNLDSYRDLMNCSSPGLAACKPNTVQRLDLVPDPNRWISAIQYMCDQHQDMACDEDLLSGMGQVVGICLTRVKINSASDKQLLNMTGDKDIVRGFCSIYDDTSACFRPLYAVCGEPVRSVFSRLREGARFPPCDSLNSTPTSVRPTATSGSRSTSMKTNFALSELIPFVYFLWLAVNRAGVS